MVKRLPTMQETWVRSLGREDPPEKEMATHSRFFAWEIPWTEETGGLYSPWGGKDQHVTEQLNMHLDTRHYRFVKTHRMRKEGTLM